MTQISLLDPLRLSRLLREALSWRSATSSLMVSAANGSILAYAFRDATPAIKDLRTMSTTMTAAYTVASEDTLVFEAQLTRALSVITPIGDHLLLAVNGPTREASPAPDDQIRGRINGDLGYGSDEEEAHESTDHLPRSGHGEEQRQLRQELEEVADNLAGLLREELAGLKWPGDI